MTVQQTLAALRDAIAAERQAEAAAEAARAARKRIEARLARHLGERTFVHNNRVYRSDPTQGVIVEVRNLTAITPDEEVPENGE